jgi:hypothetical protein
VVRSVLAVLAGLAVMVVGVMAADAIATAIFFPNALSGGEMPPTPPAFLAANLTYGALFAVFGGFVAALVARRAPLAHAAALAAVALVGTVVSTVLMNVYAPKEAACQPPWYPYVLAVLGPACVLLGGWLRSLSRPARAEPAPR